MTRTIRCATLALLALTFAADSASAQYYGYGDGYGRRRPDAERRVYRSPDGGQTSVTVSRGSRLTCEYVHSREPTYYGDRDRVRRRCRPNY